MIDKKNKLQTMIRITKIMNIRLLPLKKRTLYLTQIQEFNNQNLFLLSWSQISKKKKVNFSKTLHKISKRNSLTRRKRKNQLKASKSLLKCLIVKKKKIF